MTNLTEPRADHHVVTFKDAYTDYAASNQNTRSALWELCIRTYDAAQMSTIVKLSESIGLPERADSIGDWCKVGWLIAYCGSMNIRGDGGEIVTLRTMWDDADALSYDHLLRAAKAAKRLELDPEEILERLYCAANGGQKAESLERDIEEAHEPPLDLIRRDWKRFDKRVTQNIESFIYRLKLSDDVWEKWQELRAMIEQPLAEAE